MSPNKTETVEVGRSDQTLDVFWKPSYRISDNLDLGWKWSKILDWLLGWILAQATRVACKLELLSTEIRKPEDGKWSWNWKLVCSVCWKWGGRYSAGRWTHGSGIQEIAFLQSVYSDILVLHWKTIQQIVVQTAVDKIFTLQVGKPRGSFSHFQLVIYIHCYNKRNNIVFNNTLQCCSTQRLFKVHKWRCDFQISLLWFVLIWIFFGENEQEYVSMDLLQCPGTGTSVIRSVL